MSIVSLVKPQSTEPTLDDLLAVYETLDGISRRALLDEAWRLADEERDLAREFRWPH